MRPLKTVSQVCQAYADARRRFEKERRWIERGNRTTDRARDVRRVAIAWAQLMIPATLRQKRFLNGICTTCERQDRGFSVELRTDSRLIPERVELRPRVCPLAKYAVSESSSEWGRCEQDENQRWRIRARCVDDFGPTRQQLRAGRRTQDRLVEADRRATAPASGAPVSYPAGESR